MKLVALPVLLLLAASTYAGDFDYSAYAPSSLAEVIASADIDPRADYYFDAALPRYKTIGTFTGKTRPIAPQISDFITMWAKADQLPASYRELFKTEVEIEQDSVTYWMPIQQSLVESFHLEVAPGQKVTLYILLMGEYRHSAVFGVSGFDSEEV
jgi:hypothetical protein